jgi:predicted MPP superfamily phosphohydrolase
VAHLPDARPALGGGRVIQGAPPRVTYTRRVFPFYLILAAIGLADLGWWRWADNRLRPLRRSRLWRSLLTVSIAPQLLYLAYFIVAPRSSRRVHSWAVPTSLLAGFYLWSLIVLPASLIAAGIGRATAALVRRTPPAPSNDGITCRQMLSAAAVAVPPLLTAAGVLRAVPQLSTFRVRRMHLAIPGLPADLDGITIAHVSDLHLGRFTRPGFVPKVADAPNALRAELVLFTGDLIDLSIDDLPRGIEFLGRLDPRSGLAIIEGNHDLIDDADAFDDGVRAAGFPLLIDEATTVRVRGRPVQLLGTRWGMATGDRRRAGPAAFAASVAALSPLRDPDAFPILMAHHPHAWDPAVAAGFPLVLAGHTHGGQLMLTDHVGAGPAFYRYWSGRYARSGSQLVVSNGVGNWFPLRVNAPAEIIHLTLHPATA